MFHVHKSKKRRPTAPAADVGDSMQPLYVLKGLVDLRSRSDHGCPPHVEARESVVWLILVSKSPGPTSKVKQLFVRSSHRGRGYGGLLLEGIKKVWLSHGTHKTSQGNCW